VVLYRARLFRRYERVPNRIRFAIAALASLMYAGLLYTEMSTDGPHRVAWSIINASFALAGVWASLGATRQQVRIAFLLAGLFAAAPVLSGNLIGFVWMGVSIFSTVAAWQWITSDTVLKTLTAPRSGLQTIVRYSALVTCLVFLAALSAPSIRWLSPPPIPFLLTFFVLPLVAFVLAPTRHALCGGLANVSPVLSIALWPDPQNPDLLHDPFALLFFLVMAFVAAAIALALSDPFARQAALWRSASGPTR
jgi:hypothetical protein